jgi:hypothetical protein
MVPANYSMEHSWATVGVMYLRYHGSPVTIQKSEHDQFPLVANDWGTIHPVPDMALSLLIEEEVPPI